MRNHMVYYRTHSLFRLGIHIQDQPAPGGFVTLTLTLTLTKGTVPSLRTRFLS